MICWREEKHSRQFSVEATHIKIDFFHSAHPDVQDSTGDVSWYLNQIHLILTI